MPVDEEVIYVIYVETCLVLELISCKKFKFKFTLCKYIYRYIRYIKVDSGKW